MASRTSSAGERSAAILPVVMGLLLLWGCSEPKFVSVDSVPPGATVWQGEEILGVTPLAIPRPETDTISYTLRHSGFDDAPITLSHDQPELDSIVIELKRPGNLVSLQCDSRPSGASVFLDGEFMGRTPLLLEGLKPGTVEVAFRMKNRQQASQTLELSTDTKANRIDVEMKSLTEQYYLQQIQEHPDNMHHYVDLAHHYTLENQFEKTMRMFEKGMSLLVQNPAAPDASRLWTEIDRVITEQYDYGDSVAVNA
ncbi:MAG: PEGA domain-containing protein, partial [Lentisphaeria bacterium]|nr:PEGA domain-containing protein [Lentisphaeria bacterium]